MKKITLVFIQFIILIVIFANYTPILAAPIIDECETAVDCLPNGRCLEDVNGSKKCSFPTSPSTNTVQQIFGKITPPDALKNLVNQDPTGAKGISAFFTNFIALIYSLAIVTLILILIWGAWDWMTSEGDKEKIQNAQRKIVNALIGIMLFAAAFAIIQVLGQFTGFKFFVGQK